MTETKTVCDRCGKEIKGFPRMKLVTKRANQDNYFEIRAYIFSTEGMTESDIDLCADCEEDFKRWLEEKGEE